MSANRKKATDAAADLEKSEQDDTVRWIAATAAIGIIRALLHIADVLERKG